MGITNFSRLIVVTVGVGCFALTPPRALAHCDGLDGPVVKAAQRALETRNPALVLIWVQEQDEPEIREAFEQTLAVRELGLQHAQRCERRPHHGGDDHYGHQGGRANSVGRGLGHARSAGNPGALSRFG